MKIRYYGVKRHIGVIAISMIVIFFACVVIFPILIRICYLIFENWNWLAIGNENSPSYIPDFLGGLIGIIIGFLFDLIFIDRIKRIIRYRSLVTSLTREFQELINKVFPNMINISADVWFNNSFEVNTTNYELQFNLSEADKKQLLNYIAPKEGETNTLDKWALDDIVSSAENDSLVSFLPRYFFILEIFKKPQNEMAVCLHHINGALISFNDEDDLLTEEERVNHFKQAMKYIGEFFIYTNKKIHDLYKEFYKRT